MNWDELIETGEFPQVPKGDVSLEVPRGAAPASARSHISHLSRIDFELPSPFRAHHNMASFEPLPPKEEDELHKLRLLNVEEKPFKRISKRLLTPHSLLNTPSQLPTPPPDVASSEQDPQDAAAQKLLEDRRQFREDILFDFAAFDSSMARIQFLLNSNTNERERYSSAKAHILETAQQVRDNTAQLRIQLDEAKKTLEQRKTFDKLAEKITGNILLRPREDQASNLEKLEEECRELERERTQYGVTWAERREQFGRIVEEGMSLRRLIRDEKEEVERREGMAEEEDGEVGEGSRGGQTPKHSSISGNATPRPDNTRAGSPDGGLKPRPHPSGTLSRPGSRATSRAASPAFSERRKEEAIDNEDSQMMDSTGFPVSEAAESQAEGETPIVTIDEPETEDKMDTT